MKRGTGQQSGLMRKGRGSGSSNNASKRRARQETAAADAQPDDFVAALVRDPKQPPRVRILTGWFGISSEPNHRRLYLDAELRGYIDVPSDAVLHREEIGKDRSLLRGSIVWVNRDVELKGNMGPEKTAGDFLRGRVIQEFFQGFPGVPSGAQVGAVVSPGLYNWTNPVGGGGYITSPAICGMVRPTPGYLVNVVSPGYNWTNPVGGGGYVTSPAICCPMVGL